MSNLDFCAIYTTTGQIDQISYAQKAVDSGDTCIGIRSRHGVVLIAEKPRISPLYVLESDEKVRRIMGTVAMTHTGVVSDGLYVLGAVRDSVLQYKGDLGEDPSPGIVKMYLNDIFHYFTRNVNLRILGTNTLTSVYKDNKFSLLYTDCSGRTLSYKAMCIGKGARRIKTELEKLEIDGLGVEDMVDVGVKTLYMAHDPSKDKEFDIEVGIASVDGGGVLRKLKREEIQVFVDKYSHISVDEDN